jgi:hypothetical protein
MSCILYYSKYCEVCKKYLQQISKTGQQNDIHFICIDKRVKEGNKTFIILENGQKIVLPENITRVPALLLLNQGYNVLYGEQILQFLKPKQEVAVRQATRNNMEPMAFSFGGGFSDVVSDTYSFLDQGADELEAKGNGGLRQMHNYMDLNTAFSGQLSQVPTDDTNTTIRGVQKMGEESANQMMEERMKKMQEERENDMKMMAGNRPLGF